MGMRLQPCWKKKKKKAWSSDFHQLASSPPLCSPWPQRLRLTAAATHTFTRYDRADSSSPSARQRRIEKKTFSFCTCIQNVLSLPSASLLPSNGTGRDIQQPGSSGWMLVWNAGDSRTPVGFVGLRPGRTPPVSECRRRMMQNTESKMGKTFEKVYFITHISFDCFTA